MVWANPRSLATTYGITFVFFSSAYLDVSVQRVRPPIGVIHLQCIGLPHSDTCGSIRMCQSPQLFAAYHVLLRLWEPRHPPYALILLIIFLNILYECLIFLQIKLCFLLCLYFRISICQWTFIAKSDSWRIRESNPWPPACKAGALASWANSPLLLKWMLNPVDINQHPTLEFPLSLFSSPGQTRTADPYIISVVL